MAFWLSKLKPNKTSLIPKTKLFNILGPSYVLVVNRQHKIYHRKNLLKVSSRYFYQNQKHSNWQSYLLFSSFIYFTFYLLTSAFLYLVFYALSILIILWYSLGKRKGRHPRSVNSYFHGEEVDIGADYICAEGRNDRIRWWVRLWNVADPIVE